MNYVKRNSEKDELEKKYCRSQKYCRESCFYKEEGHFQKEICSEEEKTDDDLRY